MVIQSYNKASACIALLASRLKSHEYIVHKNAAALQLCSNAVGQTCRTKYTHNFYPAHMLRSRSLSVCTALLLVIQERKVAECNFGVEMQDVLRTLSGEYCAHNDPKMGSHCKVGGRVAQAKQSLVIQQSLAG